MSRIISLEGLNRSGKGTQISLLKELLESHHLPVEVLRGDGSRPGNNSFGFYDPESDWWKEWQAKKNKSPEDWNSAYELLNAENDSRKSSFLDENIEGYIIMDRSYISRYFMLRQQGINASLNEIASSAAVVPEAHFYLNVPKNTLLERVSDDNPTKTEFRREIVIRWYDLWSEVIKTAKDFLKDAFKIVDGTQSPQIIHNYIASKALK